MLKILRNKKTAKKIWIGLAIIIIPAFAFWGFGGADRDQKETAVAGKIFGKSVSTLDFKSSLLAVKTSALMRFGEQLADIEKYLNYEGQAWERLILLHEAKVRRINISDKEVIETIQNSPYFQDKKGFNKKIYQDVLRYGLRLQARTFEEQTRQSLALTKLYQQITQDVKFSDKQTREEYLKMNQELSIDYISSLFSEFNKNIKPTEKEIKDYFEKNKEMFKQPGAKDKPAFIPELTTIKDKVKETLIKETARKSAENKINTFAHALKTTEFEKAAFANKLKINSTALFKSSGTIKDLGNAEIFFNSAIKLKDKETSGVLSNELGYYIIKLKTIKPIDEVKFNQEKADLSKRLLSAKKDEVFAEFTSGLIKKAQ